MGFGPLILSLSKDASTPSASPVHGFDKLTMHGYDESPCTIGRCARARSERLTRNGWDETPAAFDNGRCFGPLILSLSKDEQYTHGFDKLT